MVKPRLVLLAPSNLPRRGRLRQRSFSAFERLFGALSQFVHLVACFNSLIKPPQSKITTEAKAFPRGEGWMGLLSRSSVLQKCKIYNTEPWMGLFVTCKSIVQ